MRRAICIPAGIAGMRLVPFIVSCTVGSLAWCVLLVEAGRLLRARHLQIEAWLNPVTDGFVLLVVAAYLYRVAAFRPAELRP